MKCPITYPGCYFQHVGSSFVGLDNPQDIDFLCYVPDARIDGFVNHILDCEFKIDGAYTDSKFFSYRRDNYNLIVTHDWDWFCNFRKAAHVCKALGVVEKDKRIYVHEMFLKENNDKIENIEYEPTIPF